LAPNLPLLRLLPLCAKILGAWPGGRACSIALALITPLRIAWRVAEEPAI
jgi:hypothetical protein